MNDIKTILLSLGLVVVAGCATSPSSSKKIVVSDDALREKAKVYKQFVHVTTESELSHSESCAKLANNVKVKWDWHNAVEAGNICLKGHEYGHVEDIGNELSVREPSAPWGPFFLGSAAREKGQLERALWMAELALKRGPDMSAVYYLKGQVLWDKKDYKNAVASFEKSIEFDDNNIPAHLFVGQVYFRDQDYSRASKNFYTVLKFDPRHPLALLGLAESQLHDNNPQGALEAYGRLAEAYPRDGQYLTRIAEIYETVLNDPAKALMTYQQIHDGVKVGRIQKNIDPQNDSKLKELQASVRPARAMASTDSKNAGTVNAGAKSDTKAKVVQ